MKRRNLENIAQVNKTMGDEVGDNIQDVNGYDISGILPTGFGSSSQILVDDNTKKAIGIQRQLTYHDQAFIQNYISFLEKDFKESDIKEEHESIEQRFRKRLAKRYESEKRESTAKKLGVEQSDVKNKENDLKSKLKIKQNLKNIMKNSVDERF